MMMIHHLKALVKPRLLTPDEFDTEMCVPGSMAGKKEKHLLPRLPEESAVTNQSHNMEGGS
jgi:hypothetical protein